MNRAYQRGPQGVRGDRDSGSKVSKRTPFHPFYSATEKTYARYYERFRNRNLPWIHIAPTHSQFIFPATRADIQAALKGIPAQFMEGIKAILVPSGSNKQITAMKSRFLFGEYWQSCIFLHPYPRAMMTRVLETPNPAIMQAYTRAGATVVVKGAGFECFFEEHSLQRFYLRDVLVHEIGHHNARAYGPASKKSEGFAKWFATEYGYRLWDA